MTKGPGCANVIYGATRQNDNAPTKRRPMEAKSAKRRRIMR